MRQNLILTVFLFVATLFTGLANPAHAQEKPPETTKQEEQLPKSDFEGLRETDSGIVTDIIDPLTIKLKSGAIIHLTGLDYPDLDYYTPGNFSLLATNILKDMLVGNKVKLYQSINKSGLENRMGHKIAHLERIQDGLWVQGTMLSLGLARVRTTTNNAELAAQMLAFEKQARTEKIGLWDVIYYGIQTAENADRHIGSYQIIEGTIQNVGIRENRIYLNFGKNWRDDFTASISPTNKRDFRKAGFDFQNMNGQKIRVRGWVSSYNGAYMDITHPEQIETLSASTVHTATGSLEKSAPRKKKGDALPEVETSPPEAEPETETKTKRSVKVGDPSVLKRATSINQ